MALYLQKQIPVIGWVLPKAIRMGLLVFFPLQKPLYVLLGDENSAQILLEKPKFNPYAIWTDG